MVIDIFKTLFKMLWLSLFLGRNMFAENNALLDVKKHIKYDWNDEDKVARYVQIHLEHYPLNVFRINKFIKELENARPRK